jgi:hypothetical protein
MDGEQYKKCFESVVLHWMFNSVGKMSLVLTLVTRS